VSNHLYARKAALFYAMQQAEQAAAAGYYRLGGLVV